MRRFQVLLVFLLLASCLLSCQREASAPSGKLQVVTTLFPLYDFARQIGGERVQVSLLLPPGVEPHSFEPKPDDIIRVSRAAVFIFTNKYMEPWAEQIATAATGGDRLTVDASRGVKLLTTGQEPAEHTGNSHRHQTGAVDPHIWLDFGNDRIIVDTILAAFIAKDPAGRDYYTAKATAYKDKLAVLDEQFKQGLSDCSKRDLLHGGHFAFGYLARRYGLRYQSAYAFNASAEPTAVKLAELVTLMRKNDLQHIYTEELLNPRVAETIARETGARLLKLNGAHNISKQDFDRGITFVTLMEDNLKNLRMGLRCR